nr:MAG TPA: Protein of unknown function (DUF3789) [Caudoviricetes sp.]
MTLFGAGFISGGFVAFVAMCVAALRANDKKETEEKNDVQI